MQSLQERYTPANICFGCGPANPDGLQIRSFEEGEELVCTWTPKPMHQAFEGVVNGGIIGSLLDCHCNWTAAMHILHRDGLDHFPPTVTADYAIKLRRPTPLTELHLRARVVEEDGPKVTVEAELTAGGKVCATCRGTFVKVEEGHPAYHRW